MASAEDVTGLVSDHDKALTATMFSLDADRRVHATREVVFTSRLDLLRHAEAELHRHFAVEIWRDGGCLLCLDANGGIDVKCGKRSPPVSGVVSAES
jgi:hypothetical protein